LIWTFPGFPVAHQADAITVPRLGHDLFLSNHFQIITRQSSYQSKLYFLDTYNIIEQPTKDKYKIDNIFPANMEQFTA
jgi:hypothetical protein